MNRNKIVTLGTLILAVFVVWINAAQLHEAFGGGPPYLFELYA